MEVRSGHKILEWKARRLRLEHVTIPTDNVTVRLQIIPYRGIKSTCHCPRSFGASEERLHPISLSAQHTPSECHQCHEHEPLGPTSRANYGSARHTDEMRNLLLRVGILLSKSCDLPQTTGPMRQYWRLYVHIPSMPTLHPYPAPSSLHSSLLTARNKPCRLTSQSSSAVPVGILNSFITAVENSLHFIWSSSRSTSIVSSIKCQLMPCSSPQGMNMVARPTVHSCH